MPSAAYFLNNDATAQAQSDAVAAAGGALKAGVALGGAWIGEELIAERMELAPFQRPGRLASAVSERVFGLKKHGLKLTQLSNVNYPIAFKEKANVILWRNRYARQAAKYVNASIAGQAGSEFVSSAVKSGSKTIGIRAPTTLWGVSTSQQGLFTNLNLTGGGKRFSKGFIRQVRSQIKTLVESGDKAAARKLGAYATSVVGQSISSYIIAFDVASMVSLGINVARGAFKYFEGLGLAAKAYARESLGPSNSVEVPDFVDSQANQAMRQANVQELMQSRQQTIMQNTNEAAMLKNNPYKFYRYIGG